MPTYEYKCEKCGKRFEVFQSMKDEPLQRCEDPDCGGDVSRIISGGGGLLFKGSGFYVTDYRSESYKKAAKAESDSGATAASGGGEKKKSDAKKADTKTGTNAS